MPHTTPKASPLQAPGRLAVALCLLIVLATVASAQVTSLYFREVAKDGRIYVFNTSDKFVAWSKSGDLGTAVMLIGRGPNGETIVGENEAAIDMYLFKHDLPGYDRPTPLPPPPSPSFPKTTIGGRVYADATSKTNKDEGTGTKSSDSGVGVDLKRFYFTATHDFDATWSAQFQTDIGDVGTKRYDVFVKKAYIQYKASNAAAFRIGAADTPWVSFAEGIYGQRYFEQVIVDSLGFGTSAEWGLHFLGKAADNKLGYAFTIGNGKGYSSPSRSKTVDYEGRISFEPIGGLTLAVGGYSGKRGQETDAASAKHTATRLDALANWVVGPVKLGGEYFMADNWNQVTKDPEDTSGGYSGWLQVGFAPGWTAFTRYDSANPSKDLKPALKLTSYNLGVQWKVAKPLVAALAYKHGEVEGGTVSTGNGSIGSATAGAKGTYDEVGFWFSFDF